MNISNIKRFVERQALGDMVRVEYITIDSDLWLWHCVADYFTHE